MLGLDPLAVLSWPLPLLATVEDTYRRQQAEIQQAMKRKRR